MEASTCQVVFQVEQIKAYSISGYFDIRCFVYINLYKKTWPFIVNSGDSMLYQRFIMSGTLQTEHLSPCEQWLSLLNSWPGYSE